MRARGARKSVMNKSHSREHAQSISSTTALIIKFEIRLSMEHRAEEDLESLNGRIQALCSEWRFFIPSGAVVLTCHGLSATTHQRMRAHGDGARPSNAVRRGSILLPLAVRMSNALRNQAHKQAPKHAPLLTQNKTRNSRPTQRINQHTKTRAPTQTKNKTRTRHNNA